jgi:hypothetical protein
MAYIDWSDGDDMFGLLVDYFYDARSDAEDPKRRSFLSGLIRDLEALQERFDALPGVEAVSRLREIHDSVDEEFSEDPVIEHLAACADELERIFTTPFHASIA